MSTIHGRTSSIISRIITATVLSAFVVSCGEAGILVPNMERVDEAEIRTAADGAEYPAGSDVEIELQISDTSRAADLEGVRLQVFLYGEDQIAEYELDEDILNHTQSPAVVLPDDLDAGYYELRYRLYQRERVVASHVQGLFVTAESISTGGISMYPSRFEPDSQGILQISLQGGETSANNPYAVWRFDSRVVAHGQLRDGFDEVLIRSPAREGVYSVLVDIYPAPPRDGIPFSFASVNRRRGEVVVTNSPPVRQHELQPASSYYSLLRLNGNLRDFGRSNRDDNRRFTAVENEPELVIERERLGHRFSGSDVITASTSVFPEEQSQFMPFTVTFRGRFTEANEGEVWVESVNAAGSAEIFSQEGVLTARLTSGDEELQFQADRSIIPNDTASQWSFSYFVQGEAAYGMWLVNGILMRADSLPLPESFRGEGFLPAEYASASTSIGHGVRGVIEEFGVYDRDESGVPSFNTGEFRQAMELAYPHTLIYATAFTDEADEEFSLDSGVVAEAGYLLIPPGESVSLPDVLFNDGDIIFELLFAEGSEKSEGRLRFDGLSAGSAETLLSLPLAREMQVQVGSEQDRLVIRGEQDQQDQQSAVLPEMTGVNVTVENQSNDDAILRLSHVLARDAESSSSVSFFEGQE